jgi:tetratricopeptide (TPR) repeat protein
LAACKNKELHDYRRAIELSERGCQLSQWKDRKLLHTLAMANNNFALDLAGRGEFGEAIRFYRDAIEADPRYEAPLFNLALLLATCDDERLRRAEEAVRLAQRGCQLTERRDANGLWILASANAGIGLLDAAIALLEEAVKVAQAAGRVELANELQRQSEIYRKRASSPATEN